MVAVDEASLLRTILSDPSDEGALHVYADWLEEQSDTESLAKAEYIRLMLAEDGNRDRLRQVAGTLSAAWCASVSHIAVEGCRRDVDELKFDLVCDLRWDQLAPSADPKVRMCHRCVSDVHFCVTLAEAQRHTRQQKCVAIDLSVRRRGGDLKKQEGAVVLGTLRGPANDE